MPRVFISYRRAVSSGQAGRLYDRLAHVYGSRNVFLDAESIPPGETFDSYILSRINETDIFLALLAEGTLDRIQDEDDWVRREIVHALENDNIRVIPVLVDGFEMPSTETLPQDMQSITLRNAAFLYHHLFDESLQRVIESINAEFQILDAPRKELKPNFFSWLESNKWQGIAGIVAILSLIIAIYTLTSNQDGRSNIALTQSSLSSELVVTVTREESNTATHEPSLTITIEPSATVTNTLLATNIPNVEVTDSTTTSDDLCEGQINGVRGSYLNQVFTLPNANSPRREPVERGSTVEVLQTTTDFGEEWYEIGYSDTTGWILNTHIQVSGECP